MIYLPENPFDIKKFTAKVKALLKKQKSVVVAVSEGIKTKEGKYVCELGNDNGYVDAFGHKQLTGTATFLANTIQAELGCKTRAIEFSTLQRSAAHLASRTDINEAFAAGGAAVKAAFEGDNGKMIILKRVSDDPYQCTTDVYDVHKISNVEKLVPKEWITEDGTYVSDEFISYIEPLIQAELIPLTVEGIPRHLVLDLTKK